MAQVSSQLSTGLPGFDRVIKGLIPGDNIVWRVSSVEDYAPFVDPYCAYARAAGQQLVYFRFARHEPLVSASDGAAVHRLRPEEGFEAFITEIHRVIQQTGRGGYYVFDCLSDLAADWYSDQMLGNFFRLTCPYLYDMEAIAYFGLLRNHHSSHATSAIAATTQILLDVYRHKGRLYVHPLKVQQRYSPTMYMLHAWEGEAFLPLTQSAATSEVLTSTPRPGPDSALWELGVWNRAFLEAEEVLNATRRGEAPHEKADACFRRLLRMAVSRDERVLTLLEAHVTLADVLTIRKRMIGTGLVGGKSVGMLLARAILERADPRWEDVLEPHDSFYVGSDVFYTFLVQNGIWWVRERQRDPKTFLDGAERARHRMLTGTFPEEIVKQFEYMLDYFGQSPIIVRSSSLLEDNFGNSFAGKYESVFCANQGSKDRRFEDFLSAVRTIYASAMSERALRYRARRGILDRDEQMALLVQRVSGALQGNLFYPPIAGVGFSFNPYAWSEYIDPEAGVLRLVLGLGTRAVDRFDDDYTRVVALNAPQRRPEANFDEVRQYAQRKVDVLDLEANQLVSLTFADVARQSPRLPLELFASQDQELARRAERSGVTDAFPWVLTFEKLLSETPFVSDMRAMLATLEEVYGVPVDAEFTANFPEGDGYKINLLQCRPLPVKQGMPAAIEPPADLDAADVVLEAHGAVIGQSRIARLDRLIYVVPRVYGGLPIGSRYAVARLIGRLVHTDGGDGGLSVMLLGPGRWGTTTPSLGVPVSFADINAVSAICEIVAMSENLVPDVSLGTHFLNELIEMDILYLALFPNKEGNRLNEALLEGAPNRLTDLAPDASEWSDAVRVIDLADASEDGALVLNADTLKQQVVCYIEREGT
ncbi:MAG TPA: PEP/pyruvate-binding domain-containing protein [Phycisphaerae bacterium]|nr:PEP/pyruvate-binding domain-containing protein [Phycisphaerae bacterium]